MAPTVLEIEAEGSPREIGHAIGEAARELIAKALAFYQDHHHEMGPFTFAEAEQEALRYLPIAKRRLPAVVEELEAIARAAGVPVSRTARPEPWRGADLQLRPRCRGGPGPRRRPDGGAG